MRTTKIFRLQTQTRLPLKDQQQNETLEGQKPKTTRNLNLPVLIPPLYDRKRQPVFTLGPGGPITEVNADYGEVTERASRACQLDNKPAGRFIMISSFSIW